MALMTTVGLQFLARDRSRTGMASFGRSINNIRRRVMGMASAFLVAAGIGGIGYMIKKQMEAIDTTAKLADRIGMSTENLVALQHAAEITGMETAAMNKAMETFIRRLGEVRMGVGQATYSLEALGLTADDLVTKTPWEALKVVADRMKNLGTSADEAAAASYLFGTRAKEILTLLRQGSKGIEAFRAEADRLGLTFSRFDAAQVEAANDALTRMRDVFTGLFRQITIQMAPYIEALADKFVDAATEGEGMGEKVVNAFEIMSLAAVKFGVIIQMMGIRYKQLSVIALQSTATNLEILEVLDNFVPVLKGIEILFKRKFGVGFGEFAAELHENAEQWKTDLADLEKATKEKGSAIERFYDDLRKRAAKWQVVFEARAKQLAAAEPAVEQAKVIISADEDIIKAAREKMEALRHMDYMTRMERIENLRAYVEANAGALEEVEEAAKILNDEILALERSRVDAMKVWAAELRENQEDNALYRAEKWRETGEKIQRSTSDAFYNMIAEGMSWRDAMEGLFHDIFRAFSRMIADMIAEQMAFYAIQPAMNWLMGTTMGAIGGALGGGDAGMTAQQQAATPGWTYRFQEGGIAWRPQLTMIGEIPEAVVPLSGGRSIPVEMRGGGERSTTIIIRNEGSEKLEITQAEEYFLGEQRTLDIVMKAAQTDGPYRRSIAQIKR